jgi:hypothetical protein
MTTFLWSKSTRGLYRDDVHFAGQIPSDVVIITEEQHKTLGGQIITLDSAGSPSVAPPIAPAQLAAARLKAQAKLALDATNDIVLRGIERGDGVTHEWRAYREALRDIISGKSSAAALPIEPVFPEGTGT